MNPLRLEKSMFCSPHGLAATVAMDLARRRSFAAIALPLAVLILAGYLALVASVVAAEEPEKKPEVLMCVPLGIAPGQLTKVKARGLNLDTATEVRSRVPGLAVKFLSAGKTGVPANLNAKQAGDTQVEFELTVIAAESGVAADASASKQPLEVELAFVTPAGESLYRLPVVAGAIVEQEPNPGFTQAQTVELSQVVLGQIERPMDVDVYRVELNEAGLVRFAVTAQKFGSALDPLISLTTYDGSLITTNDDGSSSRDAKIEYNVPRSGAYFVVVQDANDLGGEAQAYQLSIAKMTPPVSFARQIAPLLQQHCVVCHGARKAQGGYRVDTYERLVAAGDSGAAGFVAHAVASSESWRRLTAEDDQERMPLKSERLRPEQIALVQTWIEEGLRFDGTSVSASLLSQMPPTVHPPAPAFYPAALPITAMAYTPSGNELLVSGYRELLVVNPADGAIVRRIGNVAERTYKIAMHPTADRFAVACGNPGQLGEVRVFKLNGELQQVLSVAADVIHDVTYSPTGDRLAVAGSDATIRVFDQASGELQREIASHLDWVFAVAWSPDGTKIASASRDKTAKVFDLASGQSLASYARHDAVVRGVMFHPSGEDVYTAGANHRWDRWKIAEAKQVRDMGLGGEAFKMVGVGNFFIVPSANNRVHLMKAVESERVREFQGSGDNRFLSVAAHEASDRLAAGSQQGKIVVWKMSTGKQLADFIVAPTSPAVISKKGSATVLRGSSCAVDSTQPARPPPSEM